METKECEICRGSGENECMECGSVIECSNCEGAGEVEVDDEEESDEGD